MQAILSVTRQRRRQPSDYEQALDDLDEEANRLRDLIESLLALARGDEHTIELNEIVDLSTLLEDVSDSLRPISEDKRLDLRSNIEPMLTIQGNSDSLIRLFVNLLDNAIKYTENGSVAVKAIRKQDLVVISIVDTGIGIAEEHMPHIFERFYQVDKSRSNRGTGLGLSLVQQIVLAHRGRIEAISKPLHGSTFIVTFPYSQELGT
jgi:signal transduction histidine kinase